MNTIIQDEFNEYVSKCYDGPMHPQQKKELERCFFAGAMFFFWSVIKDPSEEKLVELDSELSIYVSDVKRNRR